MIKQAPVLLIVALILYLTFATFGAFYKTPEKSFINTASEIRFIEEDWNLARKKAVLEGKYIFVDAYASWCMPCKMLKLTTFKNNKAAAFFNKNFINLSIDMEKGQGVKLSKIWGVRAYPTLIIFTPQGKPVIGTVGLIKGHDLVKFGEEGLQKGRLIQ